MAVVAGAEEAAAAPGREFGSARHRHGRLLQLFAPGYVIGAENSQDAMIQTGLGTVSEAAHRRAVPEHSVKWVLLPVIG